MGQLEMITAVIICGSSETRNLLDYTSKQRNVSVQCSFSTVGNSGG
jgi:hypothetical protein